jgi:hypothetical protein
MKKNERDRYPAHQQRDEDEHSFPFSDLRRSELDDETMQDYTFPHAVNRGVARSSTSNDPQNKGLNLSFFEKMKSFAEDFGGKKAAKKIEPENKAEQKHVSIQQQKHANPVLKEKSDPQIEQQAEPKVSISVAPLPEPENGSKASTRKKRKFSSEGVRCA